MRSLSVVALVAAVVVVALAGCGSESSKSEPATPTTKEPATPTAKEPATPTAKPTGGTRAPADDDACDGDTAHPEAYDFADQAAAEAAGCTTKRMYGSVVDPKTGESHDDERWVFCCARGSGR